MSDYLEWKRACQIVIGDGGRGTGGTGLLVEPPLRIAFEVHKTIGRTPNTCLLKLYNLSQDNERRIKGEFNEILINAGYEGHLGLVFRGNIRHVVGYRAGNDRIIEIDAADGDKDFRSAMVNTTLAAGTSTSDLIAHVLGSFTSTVRGHLAIKEKERLRGRTISGMTRDILDDIATENDASWSIQDGALHIVPADTTLPTEAIVLSSETGLLGAPEVSDKGIKVRCLMDPRLAVNGKVWLDNNNVRIKVRAARLAAPGAKKPATKKKQTEIARLDPDGIYKVYALEIKGDTRGSGPDWYSEAQCFALGKPIPAGKVAA